MSQFKVSDMTCGGCAASITKAIQRVDPAAKVNVDLPTHAVKVDSAVMDLARIQATIIEAGFTPEPA